MNTKTASLVIGILFLLIGILGFIPNPIVGPDHWALFHADTVHSIVHLVSGALFLFLALAMPSAAPTFHKIFGVIYFLIGVLGIMNVGAEGMSTVLGFLHVNEADNYLHIVLGLVIFLAGMMRPKTQVVA